MSGRWGRRVLSRLTVATAIALVLSSCSDIGEVMTSAVKDSGGMTRAQVQQLTPEQRFDLMRERYERMQVLMTEAQEQVSTGTWSWLLGGVGGPIGGPTANDPLRGANGQSSYYLAMTRGIARTGSVGDRADAEPVAAYFESKGWKSALIEVPDELGIGDHMWKAQAVTEDGYYVSYEVQSNGYYNMEVQSGVFWADRRELSIDVAYRIPHGGSFPPNEESVPGVYIPFPKWSDPKLWGSEFDGY